MGQAGRRAQGQRGLLLTALTLGVVLLNSSAREFVLHQYSIVYKNNILPYYDVQATRTTMRATGYASRYIWSKGFGLQARAEASRPSPDSAPLPGSARASMPPNWHAAWAHRLPLGELRVAHGGQLGGLELLRLAHVNQLGGLEPRRLRQRSDLLIIVLL